MDQSKMCQHSWLFGVLIGIFMSVYHVQGTIVIRHKTDYYFGPFKNDQYNLMCSCGNKNSTANSISSTIMNDIIDEKIGLKMCSNAYPEEVCYMLSSCKNCGIQTDSCSTPVKRGRKKTTSRCLREFFQLPKHYFSNSQIIDVDSRKHRKERSTTRTCLYPHNLKTSDVTCKKAARYVECVQKCIDGYTLPGGVIKKMRCERDENVWKPRGFLECEPYVDCTLTLKSPGNLDCYTSTTSTPATCYVKCDRYEDQTTVPRRGYECRGGKWSRTLPFCVKQGSSMKLVPPPPVLPKPVIMK